MLYVHIEDSDVQTYTTSRPWENLNIQQENRQGIIVYLIKIIVSLWGSSWLCLTQKKTDTLRLVFFTTIRKVCLHERSLPSALASSWLCMWHHPEPHNHDSSLGVQRSSPLLIPLLSPKSYCLVSDVLNCAGRLRMPSVAEGDIGPWFSGHHRCKWAWSVGISWNAQLCHWPVV